MLEQFCCINHFVSYLPFNYWKKQARRFAGVYGLVGEGEG